MPEELQSSLENAVKSGNYWVEDVNGQKALMTNSSDDKPLRLGWLSSEDALFLENVKKGTASLESLFTTRVKLSPPNSEGFDPENLGAVLDFLGVATGKVRGADKNALDLVFLIMFLLIDTGLDKRKTEGQNRITNKDIKAETTKMTFDMQSKANEKTLESSLAAAKAEQIVGGITIGAGVLSLAFSTFSFLKANKAFKLAKEPRSSAASGGANSSSGAAADAEIENLNAQAKTLGAIANTLSQLGQGIGQLIKGFKDVDVANLKYEADMLGLSVQIVREFMQLVDSMTNAALQAYQEDSKNLSQNLEEIKTLMRMQFESVTGIRQNMI